MTEGGGGGAAWCQTGRFQTVIRRFRRQLVLTVGQDGAHVFGAVGVRAAVKPGRGLKTRKHTGFHQPIVRINHPGP